MYCQYCGTKNEDSASFCGECGKPLGNAATVTTQQTLQVSEKKAKVKRKMNILGIISGVVVILGAFLPFISITVIGSKFSWGFMDEKDNAAGIIFIILAVISILLSAFGINIVNIFTGVLSFSLFWSNHRSVIEELDKAYWADISNPMLQKEFGFYCLLLGSIGLILSGIIGIIMRRNQKAQLNA